MDTGAITGLVVVIGSIVVWSVRQEGRLNAHDKQHQEHTKRHDEMREDIGYIRQRIDQALNGRGH